jgi:TorA maturation chaperone TorD
MPERARATLPKLAGELRAKLDSKSPEDYQTFFLGNSQRKDLPARSGYYVGYLVARELGRTRSLPELARMQGRPLRDAIEVVLRQLESAAPATP